MNRKFRTTGFIIFIALNIFLIGGFALSLYNFIEGWNNVEKDDTSSYDVYLSITPKKESEETLSTFPLVNMKASVIYQLEPHCFKTHIEKIPIKNEILQFVSILLILGLYIVSIIYFFKFIYAVNKGKLFEKTNLKYLRILGFSLLATFLFEIVFNYISYNTVTSLFSFEDYDILFGSSSISYIQPIAGLSALLVRQILAIGIEMKEEQELTI